MNIALCDDFEFFTELLKELIEEYKAEHNITDILIQTFDSGEVLLSKITDNINYFDLIFLDQNMKKLTGSETALQIRQLGGTCEIVFVSSELAKYQFMCSKPLRILRKPPIKEDIYQILSTVYGS